MAPPKKRIPMSLLLLPLLGVLGLAGFIGLNLYREYQKTEAEDDEVRRQAAAEEKAKRQAARKARLEQQAAADAPAVDAGVPDDDDLSNLPKGAHKKPPPAVKPVTGTPAQRAFQGFKNAYDKLEAANETAAKKFRAQRLRLEDQLGNGSPANEAKFVADCDDLKAKILEALRNPENQ